jgi:hypothetical protein
MVNDGSPLAGNNVAMEIRRAGALSFFAAAFMAVSVSGQVQDPVAKAASILAESRKALGGDDKLSAIKTLEIKGTARRGAGDVNVEGDMTIVMERPGKYLRKEQILLGNGGIDVIEGLNGTESWEEQKFSGGMNFDDGGGDGGRRGGGGFRGGGAPGQPPAAGAAPDEAAKQAALVARQSEVARIALALFLTTDQPVKHTGTAVTPQMTAEVLEMTAPDGNAVRLIIDSKTYMPLMLQWTGLAQDPIAALAARAGFRGRGRGGRGGFGFPGGRQGQQQQQGAKVVSADELAKPTALRMYLQDYRSVNGIKLPHLLVRGTGDQVTEEWEIKSYKINPNLKADTFKK